MGQESDESHLFRLLQLMTSSSSSNSTTGTEHQTMNASTDFDALHLIDGLKDIFVTENTYDPVTENLLIFAYTFIAITGLIFNSFVILIIVMSEELVRNPSNVLVLNLMISDIVMSVVCVPFTLIWLIKKSWPFGRTMCKLIPTTQGASIFMCSMTISMIAIDRWMRVTRSTPILSYRQSMNRISWFRVICQTAFIWSVSMFLALPVWFTQELVNVDVLGDSDNLLKCLELWPDHYKMLYTSFYLTVQVILPAMALIGSHFKIKRYLERKLTKSTKLNNNSLFESTDCHNSCSDQDMIVKEIDRNKKVTRTLFYLSAAFLLTWLPWYIFGIVIDVHGHELPLNISSIYLIMAILHLVAMSSIPLNALLYGWCNPSIRREAKKLWLQASQQIKTVGSGTNSGVSSAVMADETLNQHHELVNLYVSTAHSSKESIKSPICEV